MIQSQIWKWMMLGLVSLLCAETIGPFNSTELAGVAPQCNLPLLHQRFPAAAFGKQYYLAVWADGERSTIQKGADIYCARIDSTTGQSIDPAGILICNADFNQSHPSVAFDGTNFLVVWEDFRSNTDYDVYAARVTEDGQVLDANGFAVCAIRDSNAVRPKVAFANGNYFVVWNDARRYPVYGIWGARVTPEGTVLDANGIVIDAETESILSSRVPANPRQTYASMSTAWWDGLKASFSVSISASESGCNIAWVNMNTAFWHYNQLKMCKINAATGAFVVAPKLINKAGKLVQDVSAHCATPNGVCLGLIVSCPGWSSSPNFFCERLDTMLNAQDSLLMPGGYCAIPQPRGFFFDMDAGTANNVRGQTSLQKFSAAYNGKNVVNALEAYWWKTASTTISKAIILMRSSLTADTLLDLASLVKVDEVSFPVGNNEAGTVFWPNLTPGPDGTVLLLYEKDYGTDNRQVVARVLRENE